jgi:hypothetical protein
MDELYGFQNIDVKHGSTFTIHAIPPVSTKVLSDYTIAFNIVNRYSEEVVLESIPITEARTVIPIDIINSLSGVYLINVSYSDNTSTESEVDSVQIHVIP